MKVVVVHKYFYPRDGVTTHIFDLIELLASHGHTVIPFAMKHPKNVYSPYSDFFVSEKDFATPKSFLEKVRLFGHMVYSFEAKKKFKKLLLQEQPDIVHIHNIYHHISPSILDACREMNISVVQTVHDYKLVCPNYTLFANGKIDEGCLQGNYFHDAWNGSIKGSVISGIADALEMTIHRMFGLYNNRVHRWIAPSEIVAQKLIAGGFPKEKTTVINHFVSVKNNAAIAKQKYLLCTGRLSEEKGFDVAIRAMKYIRDFSLVIVGEGPARPSLECLAQSIGIADRVVFTGFLPREEVMRRMASATMTLVPSLWHEPFGYIIPESFLNGTLVVGSDVGAIPELLRPISDKLLVTPGDPEMLGMCIRELLADENLMVDLIQKGKDYFQTHFTPESYYSALTNVYTSVLTNRDLRD